MAPSSQSLHIIHLTNRPITQGRTDDDDDAGSTGATAPHPRLLMHIEESPREMIDIQERECFMSYDDTHNSSSLHRMVGSGCMRAEVVAQELGIEWEIINGKSGYKVCVGRRATEITEWYANSMDS